MARLSTPATAGLVVVGLAIVVGANAERPAPVAGISEPSTPVYEGMPGESLRIHEADDGGGTGQEFREVQAARPFEHNRHERISCRECHGTGERHRTLTVQTPQDCAACHHDPRRDYACGDCHRAAELPAPGAVPAPMALTVWESSRTRTLPFAHETHAGITCEDCHRTPVTRAVNRECAACHAEHHRPEANCASCHLSPERSVHQAESHLSCAGSGCHAPAAAPAPTLSRSLCVMCHTEQRNHEPGSGCTACHQIPDAPIPRAGAGAPRVPGGGGP